MKVMYFPFIVKMYRDFSKLTIVIWETGNVSASIVVKQKYPSFSILKIQHLWRYSNGPFFL